LARLSYQSSRTFDVPLEVRNSFIVYTVVIILLQFCGVGREMLA